MNTLPLLHTILYTSTGPGSVTSPAPSLLKHACCLPSFSTVTDDIPGRNAMRSIGWTGAARTTGATGTGAIGVLNIEQALIESAHATTRANRFINILGIRKSAS